MKTKINSGHLIAVAFVAFVLTMAFAVDALKGQGRPVCGDIFPPKAIVGAGERLKEARELPGATIIARNARLWVTYEGAPPAWLVTPQWTAPYQWYGSQKAYCRSQGHADVCITDCFTIKGQATSYTVAKNSGRGWDTVAITWNAPWGEK